MNYFDPPVADVGHPYLIHPSMDTAIGSERICVTEWDGPAVPRFRLPIQDGNDDVDRSVVPVAGQSDKDEIIIVSLRELPYEDAKAEIETYIQKAGDRKVYISELAEELRLDIDLIIDILSELEEQS